MSNLKSICEILSTKKNIQQNVDIKLISSLSHNGLKVIVNIYAFRIQL